MKKESAVKTVAKKTVEKAAAAEKAAEKVVEKAAPAVKSAAKAASAKAASATKTAAAKATATKAAAAKKPAAKRATVTAVLQYAGKEISYDELVAKARGNWNGEAIQELALYVKPEEEKVYMVVNGQEAGSFDL